jgi:hypothetical protein
MTGFVLREGGLVPLTEAVRTVERDEQGRPVRVAIAARDAAGADVHVSGEVVSRFGMPSTPWFNWVSMVRWTLPDGSTAYGEDQETWSPERFRALRRGQE